MAKIKGIVPGTLSGLIGNVVVVTGKNGKMYLRKPPRKRKYTDKQKANWKRFGAVTAFWKSFARTQVQQIWNLAEEGRRGINYFVNVNSAAFGTEGTLTDIERLHFSEGKLPLPHKVTAVKKAGDPGKLEVSWQSEKGNNLSRTDDQLMMMVAHNGEFSGPFATGVNRKQEAAVVDIPAVSGTVQGVYLFFASEKRKLYSPDLFFRI